MDCEFTSGCETSHEVGRNGRRARLKSSPWRNFRARPSPPPASTLTVRIGRRQASTPRPAGHPHAGFPESSF